MQREIWRDIKDYEELYQISNLGNIRSKKNCLNKKPSITNVGYYVVGLYNGKNKNYLVHRLVAQAFISNPNNYSDVNHKDGNKLNNNVNNLEWCSHKSNMVHARDILGVKTGPKGYIGKNSKLSKKVVQLDKNDNIIKIWDSISDVERELKISNGNICSCIKGKYHTSGGYKWKYYEI